MKNSKSFRIITIFVAVVIFVCAFGGGFVVGRTTANPQDKQPNCEVVYAEIISVNGANFHVKGLDVNDINGRGEFTFSAKENTSLVWRGTELSLSDFQKGDRIAFYYRGAVLESYPAQVQNVVMIKLLDDER